MALDINESKLEELKKRVIRNKINSIDTFCINESRLNKVYRGKCRWFLIDAPCSGIGVLKET